GHGWLLCRVEIGFARAGGDAVRTSSELDSTPAPGGKAPADGNGLQTENARLCAGGNLHPGPGPDAIPNHNHGQSGGNASAYVARNNSFFQWKVSGQLARLELMPLYLNVKLLWNH